MASAIASSLGIPKSRIINMQVSSGSILVTFDLTEPSTGSDKVTVKQAIDSLGNKVKAGTFVVTLSDGSKLTGMLPINAVYNINNYTLLRAFL